MTSDDLDLPLPWHRADKDTWYADWDHINRHALIKKMDGKYALVAGTLTDMEISSVGNSLSEAMAIANRWIMVVENSTEKTIEKMKLKFF